MKYTTSDEAFEEYMKLLKIERVLVDKNRGWNLLNAEQKNKTFFIDVLYKENTNLMGKENKIQVSSNLPFISWNYSSDDNPEGFLNGLKEWVKKPQYSFFTKFNRKKDNLPDDWSLPKFRNCHIEFEEIKITIGELAKSKLSFDFVEEIRKLLLLQHKANDTETRDFERYWFLLQSVSDIKRQVRQKERNYYREEDDTTIKIRIDKKEYNNNLKKIEKELKIICKKYPFLNIPHIEYEEIQKAPKKADFFEENGHDLQEEWDMLNDEAKDEFDGDFDVFCEAKYEEFCGMNEFD